MIDQLVTDASKPILDVGIVGAICILLIATLITRELYWQKREAARETKTDAEMDKKDSALEKANLALLTEARSNSAALHLFQDQMKSQEMAFEAFTRAMERRDK